MTLGHLVASHADKISTIGVVLGLLGSGASIYFSTFERGENLGVYSGLSWMFYVSIFLLLGALALSGYARPNSHKPLVIILLIEFLFSGLGYLIGGNGATMPGNLVYEYFLAGAKYLVSTSLSNMIPLSAQFGGWPGSPIFYGELLSILNLNNGAYSGQILFYTHILQSLFDTAVVFLIAENIFGKERILSCFSTILFTFAAWNAQSALQDTGYAYTIFLLIILLMVNTRTRNGMSTPMLLLFVALILSNLYASLLGFGLVATYSGVRRRAYPIVIYVLLMTSWVVIGPAIGYTIQSSYFVHNIFNLEILIRALTAAPATGSPTHRLIADLQLTFSLLFIVAGFAGILLATKIKGKRFRRLAIELGIYIILMTVMTVATGPAFGSNPLEAADRLYIFSLPLLVIGVGMSFTPKLILVAIVSLGMVTPLAVVASYGTVVPTFFSAAEQNGGIYLQNHQTTNVFITYRPNYYDQDTIVIYYITNGSLLYHSDMMTVFPEQLLNSSQPGIVSVGAQERILFESYSTLNYGAFASDLYSRMNVVYSNPDTSYLVYITDN